MTDSHTPYEPPSGPEPEPEISWRTVELGRETRRKMLEKMMTQNNDAHSAIVRAASVADKAAKPSSP